MPREDHKILLTKQKEFAPGIPATRSIKPLPVVARNRPQEWGIATQIHEARRARTHTDLRLVDPNGNAHSWVIPGEKGLPKPGEKTRVIQQPTHTEEYAAKKGTFIIPAGYGAGKVTGSGLSPIEVVGQKPGILRFNAYAGRSPQEFSIVDTPKGQLLYNHTITSESGVRGPGGHSIPNSKPKYREIRPEAINFDNDNEIHQAKLDGSHCSFHIPGGGRQIRAFSYRPTERETGVIEHTHKLPNYRSLTAPPELAGTVLRGELWATNKDGVALPAERIGGILNASVPKSRQLQEQHGHLKAAPFDVVRYKGKDVENASYERKLQILSEIHKKIPFLKPPPTARTSEEKERLFGRIQSGSLKETKEGVVSWPLAGGRPTKIKLRPDVDVDVVGVFPGKKGKYENLAGGLLVRTSPNAPITRVGTGFSDKQREEIWRDQDKVIGRVARVETQQVFPSGKLRAPSFKEFHIEKGRQPEEEKIAAYLAFFNEVKRIEDGK